jgi:hypothetical protein
MTIPALVALLALIAPQEPPERHTVACVEYRWKGRVCEIDLYCRGEKQPLRVTTTHLDEHNSPPDCDGYVHYGDWNYHPEWFQGLLGLDREEAERILQ